MPKSTRTRFTTLLIIALIAAVPITRVLVGLPPFWGARKATFSPPPQEVIIQAIGPTDKLSPERQRAFEPGPEFQPIPAPGSSDWLAAHNEPGQTFAQFVEQRPNLWATSGAPMRGPRIPGPASGGLGREATRGPIRTAPQPVARGALRGRGQPGIAAAGSHACC